MYPTLLVIHSLLRWIVLGAAVVALLRAFGWWSSGRPWTPTDEKVGKQFILFLDLQFVVGLLLYVTFSPITTAAFADFASFSASSA